jgi:transketolase
MTACVLRARELLAERGISAGVLHAHTVKPLDDGALEQAARSARLVVTVEEHFRAGGLGTAVLESLADAGVRTPVARCGFSDAYSYDFGSQDHVLEVAGLQPSALAATVERTLAGHAARA